MQFTNLSRCKLLMRTLLQFFLIPFILILQWPYIFAKAFKNPYVCLECPGFFFCQAMLDCDCCHRCCCGWRLLNCLFVYCILFPLLMVIGLVVGSINMALYIVLAYLVLLYRFTRILFYRCNCCFKS